MIVSDVEDIMNSQTQNDKQDKHGDQSVNIGTLDLSSDISKEDRGQGVS